MIGNDLLGIEDLPREDIEKILATAERMQEIGTREVKKVPTLRGRTGRSSRDKMRRTRVLNCPPVAATV